MVQYFHLHDVRRNHHIDLKLKSQRCRHRKNDNTLCKKRCLIGVDKCWMHTLSDHHLRIRDSNIPKAGKGLFVTRKVAPDIAIFKKGDSICKYNGETLTARQTRKRYGIPNTNILYDRSYAVNVNGGKCEDAARIRGIGSLINYHHSPNLRNCSFVLNAKTNRMGIRATKNIYNGQELFLAYGGMYHMHNELQSSTNTRKRTV